MLKIKIRLYYGINSSLFFFSFFLGEKIIYSTAVMIGERLMCTEERLYNRLLHEEGNKCSVQLEPESD